MDFFVREREGKEKILEGNRERKEEKRETRTEGIERSVSKGQSSILLYTHTNSSLSLLFYVIHSWILFFSLSLKTCFQEERRKRRKERERRE